MSDSSAPQAAQAAQQVLQLATGYIASSALYVAVKLGVAEQLAAGARSAEDLARAVGVRPQPLYRILRALASVGIFEERESQMFALTPAGDVLRRDHPASLRPVALFLPDPFHLRVYADLLHSVETGQPAVEKVTGMPIFEYLARDRDEAAVFNEAMTAFSASVLPAALEAYDFSDIRVLVDVAGGHGELLMGILKQYPSMTGILFDMEHVLAGAHTRIEVSGLDGRMRTVSGDFFKAVPDGGDAYLMKHIIHDWDDERAALILRNIRTALEATPNGKVILLESVIQAGNAPDLGKLIDLEMLALPGGRERTAEEFGELFAKTGFVLSRVVPTKSPLALIEARAV